MVIAAGAEGFCSNNLFSSSKCEGICCISSSMLAAGREDRLDAVRSEECCCCCNSSSL